MSRIILFLLFNSIWLNLFCQNLSIGEWRQHLSFNNAEDLAEFNNKIYCAADNAMFYFDKTDNTVNILGKVEGLSDIGIKTIAGVKDKNFLIIAYSNTNIDILDENNNVLNIPDIKRKQISGMKSINKISIIGENAYLSCSFGIVVLNLKKLEITDTWYIGDNASHININDFTSDNTNFYAATDNGVYYASVNTPNLADYSNWKILQTIPNPDKSFNAIEYFDGKIFLNLFYQNKDTLFVFEQSHWKIFKDYTNTTVRNLSQSNGYLVISSANKAEFYKDDFNRIIDYYNLADGSPDINIAMSDKENIIWIADRKKGMIRVIDNNYSKILPDGPATNNVFSMSLSNGQLWVSTGGIRPNWDNDWDTPSGTYGAYNFDIRNNKWYTFSQTTVPEMSHIYGYIGVGIDPDNSSNAYIGSWSYGLIYFKDNKFYTIYDAANSSLRPLPPEFNYDVVRVGGISFDNENNMWLSNPGADNPLSVRTPEGKWYSYHFPAISNNVFLYSIVIDDFNQKWIILPRNNGILVFNDNSTLDVVSDDDYKILSNEASRGNLPSSNVLSMAEDLDGSIWIGTDQGVGVIYSPANVFTGEDYSAQKILLQQDGHWQYLLETESVTAIAVDGANRKWFGTQNSGAFLMSADGTSQIQHFTEDNSPLLSNNITSIAIDNETGEVFFGTGNGIISFKSDATLGKEIFEKNEVYAYPNPVKNNYNGPIAIKGLVRDADVRITTISGNLVYKTKALGGQAIWNGKSMDGRKAYSGVYLVFCSNEDGTEKLVTKILVIN